MEDMTDNITTYLEKVENRKQVLFRIVDGVGRYVVNGNEYTEDEFGAANPVPTYKKPAREDIDGTRNWMQ